MMSFHFSLIKIHMLGLKDEAKVYPHNFENSFETSRMK